MVERNKLLSNLLDEDCSSTDLDDLLDTDQISESWYRYHAVSGLMKDQHSAHANFDFCSQVSAKISAEPAIIASPKRLINNNIIRIPAEVRRISGGFAIAASVAVATFFSVQTVQMAQDGSFDDQQVASQTTQPATKQKSSVALSDNFNTTEQYELDIFNDRYIQDFKRSDKGNIAPVSGEFVRTVRFTAEEWQAILEKSLERQRQIELERLEKLKE